MEPLFELEFDFEFDFEAGGVAERALGGRVEAALFFATSGAEDFDDEAAGVGLASDFDADFDSDFVSLAAPSPADAALAPPEASALAPSSYDELR